MCQRVPSKKPPMCHRAPSAARAGEGKWASECLEVPNSSNFDDDKICCKTNPPRQRRLTSAAGVQRGGRQWGNERGTFFEREVGSVRSSRPVRLRRVGDAFVIDRQ